MSVFRYHERRYHDIELSTPSYEEGDDAFANEGDVLTLLRLNFVKMVLGVRAAVKELRTSTNSDVFMLLQKQLEESERSVILDCETKRNSTYLMLERSYQL